MQMVHPSSPRDWVCAHAEFIAFGRTEGIGCVQKRRSAASSEPWGCPGYAALVTERPRGGEGACAARQALHLLWYCAALA